MKRNILTLLTGMALGAVLTGGAVAVGITAEPSWQNIYVDGRQVHMTAYNIGGNNFVRLRDIGKEVGFNVYWQDGVQVDSTAPYTGEAPAQAPDTGTVSLSSYKGNTLKAGDRSLLSISSAGVCSVSSSAPLIADVEMVSGRWVIAAKSPGTVTITAASQTGKTGSLTLTVSPADPLDLSANMELRQEMVRLINQVRRENGKAELPVEESLMNAAQDVSSQCVTEHRPYDHKALIRYGWPHAGMYNLTAPVVYGCPDIAREAVNNWVNSPGHLQTMLMDEASCVGTGVTISGGRAYCYMVVGDPTGHNPYEQVN